MNEELTPEAIRSAMDEFIGEPSSQKKLRLHKRLQLCMEPPVDGFIHVTIQIGDEQVIAAELSVDIVHPTVTEWLRWALARR